MVPDPIPSDVPYHEAWRDDLAVETVWHEAGQDFLGVLAPHGGDVEAETDTAAVELYKKMPTGSCSLWMVQGFDSTPVGENEAFDRYHVTSTEIDADRFPALSEIDDVGFRFCLSFHVNGSATDFEVGGLAPRELREQVGEIVARSCDPNRWGSIVDHEAGEYMGRTERNVTNRLTRDSRSGIQIEMPGTAAKTYRKTIAENLATYFAELYRRA